MPLFGSTKTKAVPVLDTIAGLIELWQSANGIQPDRSAAGIARRIEMVDPLSNQAISVVSMITLDPERIAQSSCPCDTAISGPALGSLHNREGVVRPKAPAIWGPPFGLALVLGIGRKTLGIFKIALRKSAGNSTQTASVR